MGPNARFVGYRSGDDLADHYAAADLFAFSSLTETFGNVVLEALASGLPVVALRAGGVGDIVRPGVTGLLLEPDATPEQFAAGRHRRSSTTPSSAGGSPSRPAPMPSASRGTRSWTALRDRYLHVIGRGVAAGAADPRPLIS